jgi:hypothetical protein
MEKSFWSFPYGVFWGASQSQYAYAVFDILSYARQERRCSEGCGEGEETMEEYGWSPNDRQSPYYVWGMMLDEEWLVISQHYPYSIRVLVELHDETRWSEHARPQTVEQAQALMHGLAHLHRDKPWWVGWVVMESSCHGNSVRERPVRWHPSQERILAALHKGGLLPAGGELTQRKRP